MIPDFYSPSQVSSLTASLSHTLSRRVPGLDPSDLEVLPSDDAASLSRKRSSALSLASLSSTGGSGGVLDVHHSSALDNVRTDEELFLVFRNLWHYSYGERAEGFEHPFRQRGGSGDDGGGGDDDENFVDFSEGYAVSDRIGWRVPESLGSSSSPPPPSSCGPSSSKRSSRVASLHRSITPHLDCCPERLFSSVSPPFPPLSPFPVLDTASSSIGALSSSSLVPPPPNGFWRPIQCFLGLTDHLLPNSGGFECDDSGAHKTFKTWTSDRHRTATSSTAEPTLRRRRRRRRRRPSSSLPPPPPLSVPSLRRGLHASPESPCSLPSVPRAVPLRLLGVVGREVASRNGAKERPPLQPQGRLR